MQGNFCIYRVSEEDAIIAAPVESNNKPSSSTSEVAADDTQADDDKDEEQKVENKLKLSAGLPTNYPMEIKVMVYIIRVRLRHYFSLFHDIYSLSLF